MQYKKSFHNKISYLDGKRLKLAIIAGSRLVEKMQQQLNKINVFPVPDGDTGTNMALTMSNISLELAATTERSVAQVSSQMAEAALLGAQGNSGAILAQFFHGFAENVKGKLILTTASFASAVQNAKAAAYQALSEPKEGTILTIISDWANYIERASTKTEDFSLLFKNALQRARQSLAATPQKLQVLKKAGVVDAGAQGFVHLLEGIVHFIEKGKIKRLSQFPSRKQTVGLPVNLSRAELKFRFCTECILSAPDLKISNLKQALLLLGDSLIVAGGKSKVRIHLHTNSPADVFRTAQAFGKISSQKIDDMLIQHTEAISKQLIGKIAIVTDSSCDLPAEFFAENNIAVIPLKIIFGNKVYLDKVDITPVEFYSRLVQATEHPKTSQPNIADIKAIYDQVVPYYEKIISIHLPRAVSGTLQAIETAARTYGGKQIACIDGKGISVALGLLVIEAVEAIKQNKPFEQIVAHLQQMANQIQIFISLPTIKYLVKGGRISRPKGLIGRLLRLSPIISFDKNGMIFWAAKALGEKASLKKTLSKILEKARQYQRVKFIVAHAKAPAKAQWLVEQLQKSFPEAKDILILDAAPVLGVHAGPGTAGVAFIGYNC